MFNILLYLLFTHTSKLEQLLGAKIKLSKVLNKILAKQNIALPT